MPAQAAPSSENLMLGKGQVFFDRFDANGVAQGLMHLGNVETFEISIADDKVKKKSSMIPSAPTYKEVNRERTVTVRMVMSEFHPENFALGTMGTQASLAQAATAVVAEAVMAATKPGAYFTTRKLGPISAVAVKFGATTGVLNTDYAIIDVNAGLIRILPGTILTGAVTIDYTPTAYTGTAVQVVSGGNAGVIQGRIYFKGDPTSGPKVYVNVWKTTIAPDGAIGLISDDFGQMTLTATVLDDSVNHPASPLFEAIYP